MASRQPKHFVYVLDMIGYGSVQRTKVGISTDPWRRATQMLRSTGLVPEIVAVFGPMPMRAALKAERSLLASFPQDPRKWWATVEIVLAPCASVVTAAKAILPSAPCDLRQ